MNKPTIKQINRTKNQIEEINASLKAIKNIHNQNQPKLAQLEGPSDYPPVAIGHNASHFLA